MDGRVSPRRLNYCMETPQYGQDCLSRLFLTFLCSSKTPTRRCQVSRTWCECLPHHIGRPECIGRHSRIRESKKKNTQNMIVIAYLSSDTTKSSSLPKTLLLKSTSSLNLFASGTVLHILDNAHARTAFTAQSKCGNGTKRACNYA